MIITTIHVPAHLQAQRGYSLPIQEVLDWLKEFCKDEYDLSPYSAGCDILFFDEADAAVFKLRWLHHQLETT